MTEELYKRYRPKTFKQVVGQEKAVAGLQTSLKDGAMPHAVLFKGPSGTGKTTLARIVADKLGCGGPDFVEKNAADFRGIEMVREIRSHAGLAPLAGSCRVWLIDECHKLTGDAQAAFLKLLEDTPRHVYFLLATTDPERLSKTIHTRCTQFELKPVPGEDLKRLLRIVAKREKADVGEEVVDRIVNLADGSARMALVMLQQAVGCEGEDEQLEAVVAAGSSPEVIALCRVLVKGGSWSKVSGLLKGLRGQEAEQIRWAVLGYCTTVLIGSGGKTAERAAAIVDKFRDNFYDSKHAGLALACWEVSGG